MMIWLAAILFALMFMLACFAWHWAREAAKWCLLALLILMAAEYIVRGAEAAPAHRHHHHAGFVAVLGGGLAYMVGLDARPARWCGWEMRRLVGHDPGPAYNLARNWAHWGHAASGPAPGVIGVMPHHVFRVVAVLGHGRVLAISGNDGHAVRTRVRSTARVIAWRQG